MRRFHCSDFDASCCSLFLPCLALAQVRNDQRRRYRSAGTRSPATDRSRPAPPPTRHAGAISGPTVLHRSSCSGVYTVEMSWRLRTTARDNVQVSVEGTARIDLTMPLAERSSSMSSTQRPPHRYIQLTTSGIVVDEKKIVELPLNGATRRSSAPCCQVSSLRQARLRRRPRRDSADRSRRCRIQRQRHAPNQSNNFLLDGAGNNDTFNTGSSTASARRHPGVHDSARILQRSTGECRSVVNVVTRAAATPSAAPSEFNRDDGLQSRNFFAPAIKRSRS